MRPAFLLVLALLAACVGGGTGAAADEPWLESYCRGGIAGIFNRVLADTEGDIHATRHPQDDPVPVVAHEPELVDSWFRTVQIAARTRVDPPGYAPYPYPDAIVCGVILHAPDGTYIIDGQRLHDDMMRFLPAN